MRNVSKQTEGGVVSRQFGSWEHRLAGILSSFPWLKQKAKKTYQTINYCLHKKPYAFRSELSVTRVGNSPRGEFFGYFQNSPQRNGRIVFLVPGDTSLDYQKGFSVDVMIGEKKVSETMAWNWQQGCMLWWLNDREVCYNRFAEGQYQAEIFDVSTNKARLVSVPLCAISGDGKQGYSIDFGHLAAVNPDYGYFCKKPEQSRASAVIQRVDLVENRVTDVLNLKTVLDLDFRSSFNNATHEINHISVSPDNQRIMFIHRWYKSGTGRQSRLITANPDFTELHGLADGGMVSHCTWKNNSQIIGWLQLDGKSAYYLLNDREDRYEVIGAEVFRSDGHPTVIEEEWLLTDTYPDRARMSQLLLYHLKTHKIIKLGEFYSPLKFWSATRCDLHPKYSPESQSIFFESVHTGQRCLYQMSLVDVLTKNVVKA